MIVHQPTPRLRQASPSRFAFRVSASPWDRWPLAGFLLLFALCALTLASPLAAAPEIVIVPYDAKKPLAEQSPDHLYLPYDRFVALWEDAKKTRRGPGPEDLGQPLVLGTARYFAKVGERSVTVTASLDFLTSGDDWVSVPVPFDNVRPTDVRVDGAPTGYPIAVMKPGAHKLEYTFELKSRDSTFSWPVAAAAGNLLEIELPDTKTDATINGAQGTIEKIEAGHKRIAAILPTTGGLEFKVERRVAVAGAGKPASAKITAGLVCGTGNEDLRAVFAFDLAGGSRDKFSVFLDRSLTPTGLEAIGAKSWALKEENGKLRLDLQLAEPARANYSFAVRATRSAQIPDRTFPFLGAEAARVERLLALQGEYGVLVNPKPVSGTRRAPTSEIEQMQMGPVAGVFELQGTNELPYHVRLQPAYRKANVECVYQVNRIKIELIASVLLNGRDMNEVRIDLPADYRVQVVESPKLKQYWRDGDLLVLRFADGTLTNEKAVIYLVRQYTEAPETLDIQPIKFRDFFEVKGEAVVATHGSVNVGVELSGSAREMDAAKAASQFEVLPPLERRRGFRFRTQNYGGKLSFVTLEPRWQGVWTALARLHENVLLWSAHVAIDVRQGALPEVAFSLPASLPEVTVAGDEVRETTSQIDGDRRNYKVRFHEAISGPAQFTLSADLPMRDSATMPDLRFSGGADYKAGWMEGFVIAENESGYEMNVAAKGLERAQVKDVPYLPQLSPSAQVFRTGADWSLALKLTRLEGETGRAAFIPYAEITSAIRPDGTQWHKAVYHLQNRALQFLPVRLPSGAELISVSVAGDPVRPDSGEIDGKPALLLPLFKSEIAGMAYDVEVVYRFPKANKLSGIQGLRFRDPEVPGVTIERTLWNLWLPDGEKLLRSGGNMQPVLAEVSSTEKIEGQLSELKSLVSVASSSRGDRTKARIAAENAIQLASKLNQDVLADQKNLTKSGAGTLSIENISKKEAAKQYDYSNVRNRKLGEEVASQLGQLNAEIQKQAQQPQVVQQALVQEETAPQQQSTAQQGWGYNGGYIGKQVRESKKSNKALEIAVGNNLFVNDAVVLKDAVAVNGPGGASQVGNNKSRFLSSARSQAKAVLQDQRGQQTEGSPDAVQAKLDRIIIPRVEFRDATLQEAVAFLTQKARELDTTEPDPSKRGVNVVPNNERGTVTPRLHESDTFVSSGETRITLSLTNVPLGEALKYVATLSNQKMKVEPYAVSITPLTEITDSVLTKEYLVTPAFIPPGRSAKEALEAQGVQFPSGAGASYVAPSSLIVRNTEEQLDLIDAIVERANATPADQQQLATDQPNMPAAEPAPAPVLAPSESAPSQADMLVNKLESAPTPEIATGRVSGTRSSVTRSYGGRALAAPAQPQADMAQSTETIEIVDNEPLPENAWHGAAGGVAAPGRAPVTNSDIRQKEDLGLTGTNAYTGVVEVPSHHQDILGDLALTGTNSYTGSTTIVAGTIQLRGSGGGGGFGLGNGRGSGIAPDAKPAPKLGAAARRSLAVDFPVEGRVYHFKKVKAAADLQLTVAHSESFARWTALGWTLAAAVGLLIARFVFSLVARILPRHRTAA